MSDEINRHGRQSVRTQLPLVRNQLTGPALRCLEDGRVRCAQYDRAMRAPQPTVEDIAAFYDAARPFWHPVARCDEVGAQSPTAVTLLDEDSAVKMLGQNLAAEQCGSEQSLHQLVQIFGCLPLAIATAKGVLLNSDLSVEEYIQGNNFHDVEDKVQKAIESSLTSVYERGLGGVLDTAVYLHCDSIPLSLLGDDEGARTTALALTTWS